MFHPISIESRDRLNEAVLKAYEKFIEEGEEKVLDSDDAHDVDERMGKSYNRRIMRVTVVDKSEIGDAFGETVVGKDVEIEDRYKYRLY